MAHDPDTNEVAGKAAERPVCPECGHTNIPGAAFCARCGRALGNGAPTGDIIDVTSDSQATSTYEPVTSSVTPPPASPWARPGGVDHDPGLTTALPVAQDFIPAPGLEPEPARVRPASPRGFWLGAIALVLILAVLGIYLYAAWLSDSTRSTIDGWLPWL